MTSLPCMLQPMSAFTTPPLSSTSGLCQRQAIARTVQEVSGIVVGMVEGLAFHSSLHSILNFRQGITNACICFRFRLLNLRTDMRLAFVRNGFEFPLVAAWSHPITVENINEPLQGHLALTGKNRCFLLQALHLQVTWSDIVLHYVVSNAVCNANCIQTC